MTSHPLLIDQVGHSALLLGNDAIVRGALEAGIGFASGYPGTPSSEVTDGLSRLAPLHGFAFEYAVNEKIAVEMAFAASLAGARSICAMKHLGLMSAGDPISTIPYIGVEAGMVIVSAGDPSCHTSPNEQDQRRLGPMLHLPVLDPSTPQEALELTRFAFELSESTRLPVLLRPTTRVCHSRTSVTFGALGRRNVSGFKPDPKRYVPIPVNARRMRLEIHERLAKARQMVTDAGLFRHERVGRRVIIAAGAPAATCADVLDGLGVKLPLWSLGALYPLPEDAIAKALEDVDEVLVVEELSPYLEEALWVLTARRKLKVEIHGKLSGHLPEEFEYTPEVIAKGLQAALGIGAESNTGILQRVEIPHASGRIAKLHSATDTVTVSAPPRPPTLCPGCPHRAAYHAARVAFSDDQLYFNDIGCYSLGYGEPLNTADALLCMGAGFTLASGVARVTGKRTVGFLGDSTFFHSGMPALLDAIKEKANIVAVILDNGITAMTGFQESPATVDVHAASIEAVVRALGPAHLEVVDPYDQPATIGAFKRARDATGVSVVLVQRVCPVHDARSTGRSYTEKPLTVQSANCRTCGRESKGLRCDQPVTVGWQRVLSRAREAWPLATQPEQAPCSERCPLSLCIQGYVGHIAAGEYAEALGYLVDRIVLPETVCRVCHRPCETSCVRGEADGALAINDLKRFVVQWARDAEPALLTPKLEAPSGHRVAVVGAGPAGLAAAADLARRGHEVTLLDSAQSPGGLLARGIPGFRLPPEALQRDLDRILAMGVNFQGGQTFGRDFTAAGLLSAGYDALCLAIGAHRAHGLELPGSGEAGHPPLVAALPWLTGLAQGDDPDRTRSLVSGGQVVVIGGGNAAVDAARCALRLGAKDVAMVCLEARAQMPALPEEIAAAQEEGVSLHAGFRPLNSAPGVINFKAVEASATASLNLTADLILVAIGQSPDGDILAAGLAGATGDERIFSAGDMVAGEGTVTAAIASGQRAAWAMDRRLRGELLADRQPPPANPAMPAPLPRLNLNHRPRQSGPERPAEGRASTFDEVVGTLDEASAQAEASRCLHCGRCGLCHSCIDLLGCPGFKVEGDGKIAIEASLCSGCGVCAELCPNDAIGQLPSVGGS